MHPGCSPTSRLAGPVNSYRHLVLILPCPGMQDKLTKDNLLVGKTALPGLCRNQDQAATLSSHDQLVIMWEGLSLTHRRALVC